MAHSLPEPPSEAEHVVADEDLVGANAARTASETDSFTPYRYRHFARYLGRSRQVLDVGCNTGRGGVELRQALPSARIEGVEMVARRAHGVPAAVYDEVTIGDLGTVVGSGRRFDAIVMGEVIEHVPYSRLAAFVRDAWDVLLPDGLLLLTTPNPHYGLLRWRGGSVLGGAHVSVHCPVALTQLLEASGFEVARVEGTGRVSRVVGRRFPLRTYGSYLLVAVRGRDGEPGQGGRAIVSPSARSAPSDASASGRSGSA